MLNHKTQAVFISGQGSNLKALVDAFPDVNFLIFSNKICKGLIWARRRGLHVEVLDFKRKEIWGELSQKLNDLKVARVFLLGFMKIVPQSFLETIKAKSLNIHPSVLPAFPGLKALERSFEEKKNVGCSLHKVVAEVDAGDLILQKAINPKASFAETKERLHSFEQRLVQQHFEMTRGLYG